MILLFMLLSENLPACLYSLQLVDSVKGLALSMILSKFNSLKLSSNGFASVLEYKWLEIATNNFSDSNILGEGGFGCVYKARLDEGVIVAVKKLDDGGQDCEKEFEVPSRI